MPLPPLWSVGQCRAAAAMIWPIEQYEVVHRISAVACLAGRLLGLAILCTASFGRRFASAECDGSKRRGRLCTRSRFFAEQIIGAYLRLTGRANKLGSLEAAVGASIVDPWLSQIVNPENLAELLRGGTVASELGPVSFKFGDLPASLNNAWSVWLGSEYGVGRFSVGLPPDTAVSNQFRLRMQLLDWRWKVTGIGLPERLRDQIAQELAKKYP